MSGKIFIFYKSVNAKSEFKFFVSSLNSLTGVVLNYLQSSKML